MANKKIINWGKGLGLIPNKRYKYERNDDCQILMDLDIINQEKT